MRLPRRALGALIGAFIVVLPISALAQTSTYKVEELKPGAGEVESQSNGYLHRASGYIFPRLLGEVPARKSTTYGPGDADVYYTLYGGGNGDGWISLFVYPANITLSEEVASVDQSIIKGTSGHRIAPMAAMERAPAGIEEAWFKGSIQGMNVVTGYRIARVGDWFIKARISIPDGADDATFERLGAALNAIDFAPKKLNQLNVEKARDPVA